MGDEICSNGLGAPKIFLTPHGTATKARTLRADQGHSSNVEYLRGNAGRAVETLSYACGRGAPAGGPRDVARLQEQLPSPRAGVGSAGPSGRTANKWDR